MSLSVTLSAFLMLIGAVLVGGVIGPALLPWIPGRAFAVKGWLAGLIWTAAALWVKGFLGDTSGVLSSVAYLLLLPAISAFLTMNFTGASTYTSLSGVKKEMRVAIPMMIVSALAGIGAWGVFFFWRI